MSRLVMLRHNCYVKLYHACQYSEEFIYITGLISLSSTTLANTFKWFIPVEIGLILNDENVESNLARHRFILCGWEAIIYNQYNVYVVDCKFYFN